MGASESVSLLAGCGAELVPLLLVLGLMLWGRFVAKKHGSRGYWIAAWMPLVGVLVQHVGLAITVLGLIDAFDAISTADPSRKASLLAEGIAHAMWATAIGLGLSLFIYVGCVAVFVIGTWRPAKAALVQPT